MFVYLDTETTGLAFNRGDRIVEIAIVDDQGRILINSLVNPERYIPRSASDIHGITDWMVRSKPTLSQLMPEISRAIHGRAVIIYNAPFDVSFFPDRLHSANRVLCAMGEFTKLNGGRNRRLEVAAELVGHRWTGDKHRALADAIACKAVWQWVQQITGSRAQIGGRSEVQIRCFKCNGVYTADLVGGEGPRCPSCRYVYGVGESAPGSVLHDDAYLSAMERKRDEPLRVKCERCPRTFNPPSLHQHLALCPMCTSEVNYLYPQNTR